MARQPPINGQRHHHGPRRHQRLVQLGRIRPGGDKGCPSHHDRAAIDPPTHAFARNLDDVLRHGKLRARRFGRSDNGLGYRML